MKKFFDKHFENKINVTTDGVTAAIILTILVFLFFTVHWNKDEWNNFWNVLGNIIGSGLGVFGAYWVASWQFNKQKKEKDYKDLLTAIEELLDYSYVMRLPVEGAIDFSDINNFLTMQRFCTRVELACLNTCDYFDNKPNECTHMADNANDARECVEKIYYTSDKKDADWRDVSNKVQETLKYVFELRKELWKRKAE